jgi:hypothetical protein
MIMKIKNIKKTSLFKWWDKLPCVLQILLFVSLLTVPIIMYCLPFLLTGNRLAPGDADYMMQLQEATRRIIFQYGQFPWWNPWIAGGVPLFANPNFGLYSIPSFFTLLFGSIIGYKVALSFYLVMGFWGIYLLFRKAFNTSVTTTILLGYIWTFGSFFAQRIGGHYTFFTIQFFPFILLLFLKHKDIKHSWLWLGIAIGLMINTATHYMTIMSLAIFGIFAIFELIKITFSHIKNKLLSTTITIDTEILKFLLMTGVVTLFLTFQRILYSFEYFSEYPRNLIVYENTIGIKKAIFAIFGPIYQYKDTPSISNWSWMEASAYIGISTGIVAIICLILFLKQKDLLKPRVSKISPLLIMMLGLIFFLFGLGMFAGDLSPYNFVHHLPLFSGMRVACRWLIWTSLMVLIFIALYKQSRYRKLINCLLLISVVELFIFGSGYMAQTYSIEYENYPTKSTINQQVYYHTKRWGIPYDENLTATTKSNIGQIVSGDSLIDTRQGPPVGMNTIRCDSDANDCHFVMTNNAKVLYWSPNIITLKRTAPGIIKLNMNPGKYWLVNNKYAFPSMRLTEPDKEFAINETSDIIDIKLQPKFSIEWISWKLSGN